MPAVSVQRRVSGNLGQWASIIAALCLPGVNLNAAPEGIRVAIDTSAAEAVLAAVTSDSAHVDALAEAAVGLPAIQAMLAKMKKYNAGASPESFRSALIAVAGGGHASLFPLEAIRSNPAMVRGLLDSLSVHREEMTARLRDRLAEFVPPGLAIDTKLVVVLGSNQNGWVPDQKTPTFYIDAGFQSGDADNLIAVATHELFHVVQGAVLPDWNPVFAEATGSDATAHEMHNVHAALLNLEVEGMADYVGDPRVLPGSGPGIARARREYDSNLARSSESFELFDTIIYRFSHDATARQSPLINISFGGAWGQTGYYVGYRMAKAIDRYRGRARLRALVALPPEDFVADYVAIAQAHPSDPEITPLDASTVQAVLAAKKWTQSSHPE
jgi:hypothetical protein